MLNESDLKDAIETLRDELKKSPSDVEAVAVQVAKEWDVPLRPLVVRFEKTVGQSMTEFAARTYVVRDLEAEAAAEAAEYAKDFRIPMAAQSLIGRPVYLGGERHLFVAYTGSKAYLVRVADGHRRVWSGDYVRQAMAQVQKAA